MVKYITRDGSIGFGETNYFFSLDGCFYVCLREYKVISSNFMDEFKGRASSEFQFLITSNVFQNRVYHKVSKADKMRLVNALCLQSTCIIIPVELIFMFQNLLMKESMIKFQHFKKSSLLIRARSLITSHFIIITYIFFSFRLKFIKSK